MNRFLYRIIAFCLGLGTATSLALEGTVAKTSFSIGRGFYDTNISVAITSATPGAVIRYTLNAAEPTATSGLVYSQPLAISNTTVLRAAGFKTGSTPTDVNTHTYIFLNDVIASLVMSKVTFSGKLARLLLKTGDAAYGPPMRDALLDLPTLSLVAPATIKDRTEVRASIEWLRPDGQPGFHANCGVRHYGGGYTQFAKKNFRLYFRAKYGQGKLKYPLFEGHEHGLAAVDSFDQLELRGGSHDMAQRGFYVANSFTDDTLLEMGQLNPHGRFVHLYLNGAYWGLFQLRERWGASMHQNYLGGAKENYESINGNLNDHGWADPGVPYDGDGSAWGRVRKLRKNYAALKPYLDLPEFVDYMLMWMFGGAEEEFRCVGPTSAGSGFKFYLNDADGWFCGPWYCAQFHSSNDGPARLFAMLSAEGHPDYRTLLADRIYAALFNNGPLTPAQNVARLNERCKQIKRAFYAEAARWNDLSPMQWASRRDHVLKNWLPQRTAESLLEWRAAGYYPTLDAPTLNQQGGVVRSNFKVAFAGPVTGTIYYTLDGTDPRLPGGAVSTNALPCRLGEIGETLMRNTVLKCRAKDGSQWSALNKAFFQVGPSAVDTGEVVVSDLNFKVPGSGDAEFVKLANVSARAVNLRGAKFTSGITYAFPDNRDVLLAPGQPLVLVKDLFHFQKRYGLDVPVAGIYCGSLHRGDERLTLATASNNVIIIYRLNGAQP